ncbi:MAG: hypothetical protein V2A65_09235 [Candidatus Omnitrophota bacterium]
MKISSFRVILGAVLLVTGLLTGRAFSQTDADTDNNLKIIIFCGIPGSGGQPSPEEFVGNVEKASVLPADGMLFNLTCNTDGCFFNSAFSKLGKIYTYEQIQPDIKRWRSFNLGNLKYNFMRWNIGTIQCDDWYDDKNWDAILKNVELGARCGKECNATGIFLDTEMYGMWSGHVAPFAYEWLPPSRDRFFEDYQIQARKRGRQFMEAINTGMPGATILLTFGPSVVFDPENTKVPFSAKDMSLIPAFIDGVIDGATSQNEIFDAFEQAYHYKTREQFTAARKIIREKAAEFSADPARYTKMIKVGFPVWLHELGKGEYTLNTSDFTKNSYTPEELKNVLTAAAENSDGYIWLYSVPWFNLPPAYMEVFKNFWAAKPAIAPVEKQIAKVTTGTAGKESAFSVNNVRSSGGYAYFAKQMDIRNTSPEKSKEYGKVNWGIGGDYVSFSSDPDAVAGRSSGSVSFRPAKEKDDRMIADGDYQVVIDIRHINVKQGNSGNPPAERDGSFSYQILLDDNSKGSLIFPPNVDVGWIQYFPQDSDCYGQDCGAKGPIALTDFVAYGPESPAEGARGVITLEGVRQSEIIFEVRDDVLDNYGFFALKSIRLVPVRAKKN